MTTLKPHAFARRFGRSALVGAAATLTDFVVLFALVELAGCSPRAANVPSLVLGAAVQFAGNRHFAFRAGDGALGRQATGFAAAEVVTLVANAVAFQALTSLGVAWALARPVGTFLVFVLVSYPLWNLVFRRPAGVTPRG